MKKKKTAPAATAAKRKDPNKYPKGWDRKKVDAVARHYENQSDEEAIAEAEAAYADPRVTMMAVPVDLVEAVRRLIARRAG